MCLCLFTQMYVQTYIYIYIYIYIYVCVCKHIYLFIPKKISGKQRKLHFSNSKFYIYKTMFRNPIKKLKCKNTRGSNRFSTLRICIKKEANSEEVQLTNFPPRHHSDW